MKHERLENLVTIGQLKREEATPEEIAGLVRSGVTRLEDSNNMTISIESRFDLAYNAAHALSLAALRQAGYRSGNRFIVFQCLEHTVGLPSEQWRVLSEAHRKRNLAEYEGDINVAEPLIEAMIRVAQEIADRVSPVSKE
jgi:hypothetical protein